jgi:predicted small lipoprotein YifL
MRVRARVMLLAALLAAAAGCGQQGPLVLPEDARPIERIESPEDEPDPTDDERTRER